MRFLRMSGLFALTALAFAAPAAGQEEGVFIDPDSPSAKEYRIPLESERRQADPSQAPTAKIVQGARASPIFGTGIEPEGGTRPATGGDSSAPRDDHATGNREEPESSHRAESSNGPESDARIVEAAASRPGAPGGGAGMPLAIGGVAVGVLLLGGLAGLMLRRRA